MNCRDPLAPVALDTETTDLNPFRAQLVGIGVCWGANSCDLAYIPVSHRGDPSSRAIATGNGAASLCSLVGQ